MNRRKLLGSLTGVIAACSLQVFGFSEKVRRVFCSVRLTKVILAPAYKVMDKWGGISSRPGNAPKIEPGEPDWKIQDVWRDDLVEFTVPEKVGWQLESVEGGDDRIFPICDRPEEAFSKAGFEPPGPHNQVQFIRPNGRGGWTQLPEV